MSNIGGVTFGGTQLRYLNPGEPKAKFSMTDTLDGSVVVIALDVSDKERGPIKIAFRFSPYASVEALKDLAANGSPFSFSIDGGPSGTAMIQPGSVSSEHEAWGKDAVHSEIEGTAIDYYKGELTLIRVT